MRSRLILGAVAGLLCCLAGPVRAELIVNGGFETGDLTGWTVFTTPNGTVGPGFPQVAPFDTNGDGVPTLSAQFRVGLVVPPGGVPEGGGLFQNVFVPEAGRYVLTADLAAQYLLNNNSGGIFNLLVDAALVRQVNFGSMEGGAVARDRFDVGLDLTAGVHEVRIQITRPFIQSETSPLQYLDNVSLTPVPEPSTFALIGLTTLGLVSYGWRRRKRAA
jgi:hypothetical protein